MTSTAVIGADPTILNFVKDRPKKQQKWVRGGVKILGKSANVLYEWSLGQNIEAMYIEFICMHKNSL